MLCLAALLAYHIDTMDTTNTLALFSNGKQVAIPDFGGATNAKTKLIGARLFVASKAGLSAEDCEGKTPKEVFAMAIAAGATKEDVQAWRAEYDSREKEHARFMRQAYAEVANNPAWRQKHSLAINAKGQIIGVNSQFRKEKSLSVSANARLEMANAKIAKLEALIARLAGSEIAVASEV
jgi:hypothetical protein